jgi:hypothetical protein
MPDIEGGASGGHQKFINRIEALRPLTENLPAMDSAENVKARLQIICNLSVTGVLPGVQAGAAVRACEAWLKLEAHEMDRNRMKALERQITELEAELARARSSAMRVMP